VRSEYSAPIWTRWLAALAVLLALALAVTVGPAWQHVREVPPPRPAPLRAQWLPPRDLAPGAAAEFPFGLALAPDGRRVVFPALRDGRSQLWLQDLVSGTAEPLPGTDEAVLPFWSPDGTRIGFMAGSMLRTLRLADAATDTIMAVEAPRGAAWNARGDLVVAGTAGGGLTWRTAGGDTRTLTTPDASASESAHAFPFFADETHVVYFVRAAEAARQGVWITTLDDTTAPTRLTGAASHGIPAGGRLIYANDGALVARDLRFDGSTPALTGETTVLGVRVGASPLGQLLASASRDVLVFSPPVSLLRQLAWFGRDGTPLGTLGSPADLWSARVAPDGRRVAATILEPLLRTLDIVLFDGHSLMPTRVSLSIDADETPAWSPDGRYLAWVTAGRAVTVRGAGAVLPAETVTRFDEPVRVSDWTPDGTGLIVSRTRPDTREDLWLVPVRGKGAPRELVSTPFADVQGTMSPNGRWLAYASDESGAFEIYVDAVARDRSPEPATRERVTSGGGSDPRWSRDGRELFFRRGSAIHVATPALGRGQNAVAATSTLFETRVPVRTFDVAPDGQRFLLNLPAAPPPAEPATLLVNWPARP